jgi:hypothetical protein
VQLDKVMRMWFTAMCTIRKSVAGRMTKKAKSLYDEMKITDKYIFCECSNKKLP